jgi:hypothetical protein
MSLAKAQHHFDVLSLVKPAGWKDTINVSASSIIASVMAGGEGSARAVN